MRPIFCFGMDVISGLLGYQGNFRSGALGRRADDSQQDQECAENDTQDEQDNRPPPRLGRLLQGMLGLVHGGLESFHFGDDGQLA